MRDVAFTATEPNQRRMGDFSRPMIGATHSVIVLSTATREYELNSIHFSLLPSFHGLPNEDALNFMREFCLVVQSFPLKGLTENELRMKFFYFTLKDRAKSWFLLLQPNSLANWDAVCDTFLAKYYPYSKTQELRMQIFQFSQLPDESFHDTWDRFRSLQQQCPHHLFPLEMLYQIFYDGLEQNFQYRVDSAARGGIDNCTAQRLGNIFEDLASSSQQKGARGRKVQTHGDCGDFVHGTKVSQHEAGWRPNSTFEWQLDDDEEDPIRYGENNTCELEQDVEDELPNPPKEAQAAIFYESSDTYMMDDDWELVQVKPIHAAQLSVEENSTCEDVAAEMVQPIVVEDADEQCYPDLTDEQENREECKPVFGFSELTADFFSFQDIYFIPSASYFKNYSILVFADLIVDSLFLQDVGKHCLLVGPADVLEEDERIQEMEWLKLEKEFG